MKFGPSRGNPIIIFEHFLKNFGLLIIAIFIAVWLGPELLFNNIGIFVLALINPVIALFKYIFTKYSIDDEKMVVNSGLFVKKTMEIPLKGITTVDLSQNLLFQLFQVYKIKADNSSQTNDTSNQAEIVLALKKDSALYVKSLLESKTEDNIEILEHQLPSETVKPIITCTISDFILMGAIQSKILYFVTILTTLFGGGGYIYNAISEELNVTKRLEYFITVLSPVVGIVILLFITYLLSLFASVFLTAVRYYNYTVTNRKDALLVKYGLFTKKSYTLKKDKISGVTIKQSLLMRLLGYCSIEVFIIGYGDKSEDNQQELSLLYPIAKLNKVDGILMELLPDMSFDRVYHKKAEGSLRYFFYCFRMYFALGLIIGIIAVMLLSKITVPAWSVIGFALIYMAITIISVYLEYCNSGIYANNKVVSICKGTFTKSMVFIKTGKIESVTAKASIWKQKKGITDVNLGFVAPLRVANMKARNITNKDCQEIQKVLSF